VGRLSVVDGSRDAGQKLCRYLRRLPPAVCRTLDELSTEGLEDGALRRTARDGDGMPAVLLAEQARPKVSIGHAMDVLGSLLRQLVCMYVGR